MQSVLRPKSQRSAKGDVGEKSASGSRQHLVPDRQLNAELFEEAETIPDHGGFYDFAVANLIDGDAAERNFLVRRGNAQEFAAMRSGDRPVDNQLVLLGDGVVDVEVQVGQAGEEAVHLSPIGGRANRSPRHLRISDR